MSSLVARLAEAVGSAHVLTDPAQTKGYCVDWTGRFTGPALCVVRPASTAEVAEVLRCCAAAGQAVVPQGGNTGLVGGGVPRAGEVVLSTVRLADLGPVDPLARTVEAGAGVTLAALQAHAQAAGLEVGLDLASRDSATVGGLVATNAGGIRVLRHGDARARVRGVQAVLADGTVLDRRTRLAKDNTGYDLPGLLTGSEGTLAVLTAVVWHLVPPAPHRVVALLGLPGLSEALALLAAAAARVPGLAAAETFGAPELALVCESAGLPAPLPAAHARYLLLEAAGSADPTDQLARALGTGGFDDVAVGTAPRERERLWAYRERLSEAVNAAGVPVKLDVALPLGAVAFFDHEVRRAVTAVAPRTRVLIYGHLAEGNLHVNVLGPGREPLPGENVEDAVLRLVAKLGGAISAEHGIGVAKTPWLHLTRTPADIAAMRAIKRALDPTGLLNPGVLLP